MSRGYLILAQNTPNDDYIRLAYALALSIKSSQKGVNSVALATNKNDVPEKYKLAFDYIIDIPWGDSAKLSNWKIENKWKYYYISPFDETVILDADMLFPEDISHWWDVLSLKEIWITNKPRTFRNEIITSTKYRNTFVSNNLPNVYTAFMYFKKTERVGELFRLIDVIFKNWQEFFYEFLDETRPKHLSGDVAYALAIKILGMENECFDDSVLLPSFVHMKSFLQNIDEKLLTENWPLHFPTYFSADGRFKVGNFQQVLPFHYHIKSWLSNDMIEILEAKVKE